MKKAILFLLAFYPVFLFSQSDIKKKSEDAWTKLTDSTFFELIEKCGIEFKIPEDFKVIKPKKNTDVYYQFAIKHKKEKFEIRYYINPFDQFYKDTVVKFDPNKASKDFMAIISLNASGNVLPNVPQIDIFPVNGVKNEFNADWGGTSAFVPNSDFGKGFEFCSLNSIKKDSVCQVFIFYMFNDVKKQEELYVKNLFTIRFKPKTKTVLTYHKIEKVEEYPGDKDFYIKPSNGYLFIRKDNTDIKSVEITLSDFLGTYQYKRELIENSVEIDHLSKGMYRLKIIYDTKEINRIIEIF